MSAIEVERNPPCYLPILQTTSGTSFYENRLSAPFLHGGRLVRGLSRNVTTGTTRRRVTLGLGLRAQYLVAEHAEEEYGHGDRCQDKK